MNIAMRFNTNTDDGGVEIIPSLRFNFWSNERKFIKFSIIGIQLIISTTYTFPCARDIIFDTYKIPELNN